MKPTVFCGPTLWGDATLGSDDFVWLPPAKDGDVYRAVRTGTRAIGLIDGQFESALSVFHKEILFALAQGVHVFGAASMGALRAAELNSFGVTGIGKVYERFADATLCDDDDVAVLHAGAELDFRPLSDAMVDIRATLESAVTGSVISQTAAEHIARTAKAMFFKDRHWERILRKAANTPLRKREIAALTRWLPGNKVEQKRADARAMITAMRSLPADVEPFHANFEFQRTLFWQHFVRSQRPSRHRSDAQQT